MVQLVPVDGQEIPHVVLDLFKDAIDGIPLRSTPRCVPAVLLTRWSSTSYLIIKESATDACEEDNLEAARSMAKLTLEIALVTVTSGMSIGPIFPVYDNQSNYQFLSSISGGAFAEAMRLAQLPVYTRLQGMTIRVAEEAYELLKLEFLFDQRTFLLVLERFSGDCFGKQYDAGYMGV
ncbi:hypothetical protein CYMTET_41332 [Cymbomonas tetramitiformis]|uniref:Uncharacterized protein n=1 Tax=Cymbomonas tetramitiformis TaxID=36881 RepID=A0AAE0F234_9CHLO|nr:hypothetical protein CYMTET_41332 [Cymbomonas tetramitiformis]